MAIRCMYSVSLWMQGRDADRNCRNSVGGDALGGAGADDLCAGRGSSRFCLAGIGQNVGRSKGDACRLVASDACHAVGDAARPSKAEQVAEAQEEAGPEEGARRKSSSSS